MQDKWFSLFMCIYGLWFSTMFQLQNYFGQIHANLDIFSH